MKHPESVTNSRPRRVIDTSRQGLSHLEASQYLKAYGYNELVGGHARSFWRLLLDVLKEPMLLLLLGCGSTYLLLGEPQEALILLVFVMVVILISLYQEAKTEHSLEALRDLSSPRALVIREGEPVRITGREIVVGDLLVLNEGDRIPADAVLIDSSYFAIDESLITGEAAPVRKVVWHPDHQPTQPGGDDQPYLYSGTLVVAGRGLARVTATGHRSELGKIGTRLASIVTSPTALQMETGRLVWLLALVGAALCSGVAVVFGLLHQDWLNGILSGLTLAMAILPSEFPVVLTIFLALGAFRLSKIRVLTRNSHAIETLGATTVLCTDKTGTLTENRMQLWGLSSAGHYTEGQQLQVEIPESHHGLIETAILASQRDPFDPMERELLSLGQHHAADHIHQEWVLQKEYPLTKDLLAMSYVWRIASEAKLLVAAKGAPEAIMDLCHLSDHQSKAITKDVQRMAGSGLRVLGVARSLSQELPAIQHEFDFEFVGLLGFMDPIRKEVPEAVHLCRTAGIRIVMITGDYPLTAKHIGRKIGLDDGLIVTGDALDQMSDQTLQKVLPTISVFARVVPEQKLRIIRAFQAQGDVVGMTGDGVNDAPALKAANIGIAMGKRGTDVAREASDLVLLDDAFDAIVAGVRMGRRIFDNLRKAMAYIIAVHIPIAGVSLLPIVLEAISHRAWPVILMPVHIAFLQLIIDPACSVVFEVEPEEKGSMERKPRRPEERLFGARMVILSMSQGATALLMAGVIYSYAVMDGMSDEVTRSLTFATLVFQNIFLLMANRSWRDGFFSLLRLKNKALRWVVLGTLGTLALSLYLPSLQALFHFARPPAEGLVVAFGCAIASILWFEIYKCGVRWRQRPKKIKPLVQRRPTARRRSSRKRKYKANNKTIR